MSATALLEVNPAYPNPLFTEEQRALVRFLKYSSAVPCQECGRRSKHHWTMLATFHALTFPSGPALTLADSGKVHLPFAPVCRNHPTAPADLPPPVRKRSKGKA